MVGWLADEFSMWGIHLQNWMLVALVIVLLWMIYLRAKTR
jgi:hypothetical protein